MNKTTLHQLVSPCFCILGKLNYFTARLRTRICTSWDHLGMVPLRKTHGFQASVPGEIDDGSHVTSQASHVFHGELLTSDSPLHTPRATRSANFTLFTMMVIW